MSPMATHTSPYQARTSSNLGFTLVEVLVATLIMVISIVTVTAALRQFSINRQQLGRYEQSYTTTLSLHDKIMAETLTDNHQEKGELNGVPYSYHIHLEQSANNYIYGEEEQQSGNKGQFLMMLFKIELEVAGKSVEFYKTQYKKRFETNAKDEF